MIKKSLLPPAMALGVVLLLPATTPIAGQAAGYEEPPVLTATGRIDEKLRTGPYHRVDERVVNDGFMNHFVIHSDFGDFAASSEWMLEVRVQEVYAIAKLRELESSDAFSGALKSAATAPIDAAKQIVDDPVGTVKGVPGGVTRKVRGLYYTTRKTTHKVKGEIDEAHADDDAEGAAADDEDEPSNTERAKEAAKDYVGYSSAHRELARKLQVDPYTTNEVLQAELTRLARAAFAAGLGFKMVVPMPPIVGVVNDVDDLVWDQPPEELERLNNLALRDMGIDKDTRLEFFASRALTTTTQTLLVEALKQLEPLQGRRSFVDLALAAEDEEDAWLLTRAARMLASYHRLEQPIVKLVLAGNDQIGQAVVGVTAADAAVVALPFDHVTWQPGMEGKGPLSQLAGRQLWLSGTVSPRAKSELEARGFELHPQASAYFAKLEQRAAGEP